MRALPFLACLLLIGCSSETTESEFDQARWMNADLTGRERAEMFPSFLRKHPLEGMSREEVVALLGEPTPTDKWRGAEMIYVLGNDGSYTPIDNEWLLIQLDEQGRVESFERSVD
jgi:hypothetical protein